MNLPRINNPIRWVAVICVAVTSIYVMVMSKKLIEILSGPEWCGKALQAEKISSQNFGGLTACIALLQIQLKALALNSYIFAAVIALCLLTLIVIVIAGGYVSFNFSQKGAGGTIGGTPQPAEAAQAVADSAQETATVITEATKE
jgi:hypothetical protein